jgi:uncharacterized membrane protein
VKAYFAYPVTTQYGQPIPKNKLYEKASISRALKEKFVTEVEKIIWSHKLSTTTLNLEATQKVSEIQVFDIFLRGKALNEEVLRAIDKAIPFPIVFQLHQENKVQIRTAYKRTHESDGSRWVVERYFSSEWFDSSTKKQPLPTVLNMEKLYEAIITSLIAQEPKVATASLQERVEVVNALEKLEKRYAQLKAKRNKEKQFNKKVALNQQLKAIQKEIEKLK